MKYICKQPLLVLFIMLLIAPVVAHAQTPTWSGIIDPSRATNWSGVGATITNRTTICATLTTSATTTSINSAIASCPAGGVVLLGAGTYTITGGINFNGHNNVTLRGAGPLLTILQFTNGDNCNGEGGDICVTDTTAYYNGAGPVQPGGSNACQWTGGYTQGTTTITLSSCGSAPPVNQFIVLDQASDSTDNGGIFVCNLANCNNEGGTSQDGRSINGNSYAEQQFVYVTAVSGSGSGPYTVKIANGLHMPNWCENKGSGCTLTGNQIGAWWPGQITGIGIENMTLDHSNTGGGINSGLYMYDCYNCWVKNIRSYRGAGRNHVWLYQSLNVTVRDSYFFGSHGAEESYGIETLQTSDDLIENNIFHFTTAPFMSGSGSGLVWGYNYSILNVFSFTQMNWQSANFSTHNALNGENLYEGNIQAELQTDNDWGTGPTGTMFRNYSLGVTLGNQRGPYNASNSYNPWDIVTSGGSSYSATQYIAAGASGSGPGSSAWFQLGLSTGTSENTSGIDLAWGARAWNVIGNVLGTSSYDTQYEVSPSVGSNSSCDTSVYNLGFRGTECTGATDSLVRSSLFRWGNYDTVNAAAQWNSSEVPTTGILFVNGNPVPSSHTLPPSFYLPTQPAFWQTSFGTPSFPAIGPDVTNGNIAGVGGHANMIPAQLCYNNLTTTNGILNFDANACYIAVLPAPPTNLIITVH